LRDLFSQKGKSGSVLTIPYMDATAQDRWYVFEWLDSFDMI